MNYKEAEQDHSLVKSYSCVLVGCAIENQIPSIKRKGKDGKLIAMIPAPPTALHCII